MQKRKAGKPKAPALHLHDEAVDLIHHPVPLPGCLPPTRPGARPAALAISWAAACTRCGLAAHGTTKWGVFNRSLCLGGGDAPADLPDGARLGTTQHQLHRVPGGWSCSRCGRSVGPSKRAETARRRCPVPALMGLAEGQHHVDALRRNHCLAASFKKELLDPAPRAVQDCERAHDASTSTGPPRSCLALR